jgi:hypothetical protein
MYAKFCNPKRILLSDILRYCNKLLLVNDAINNNIASLDPNRDWDYLKWCKVSGY